ncbi:MAG: heavy metal sensor histidine kinase [Firmicutes bacterium]|nr:heavy metal sensor histidine kinase [Bacillota bacterium]
MMRSVRTRLALLYSGVLLGTLVLLGSAVFMSFRHSLFSAAEDTVRLTATEIARFIDSSAEEHKDATGTFLNLADPELVQQFAHSDVFVQLRDAHGTVLVASRNLRHLVVGGAPALLAQARRGVALRTLEQVRGLGNMLVYTLPVRAQGKVLGMIQVARPVDSLYDTLQRLRNVILAGSALALLLSAVLGLWLSRAALAPIDRITSTAREISAGDLKRRLNLRSVPDDEVTRLAAAFDEMLDRLEEAFQRERQFTADASHELRTPLTIIRGVVDVALRIPSRSEEQYRSFLREVGSEAQRMTRLVENLLTLARADSGQPWLHPEELDLSTVLGEVVKRFRPLAEAKGLRLCYENLAGRMLRIHGDKDRLAQLFGNLIDNAIKYTPGPGHVTVRLGTSDTGRISAAEVSISDTGIGIPPEHLPHVFQRFYRVDKARSRQMGGSGLGLSIARQVAEAHGGSIRIESTPGSGTTVRVRLPLLVAS